jgi:hypothetical protein
MLSGYYWDIAFPLVSMENRRRVKSGGASSKEEVVCGMVYRKIGKR